MNRTLCAVGFAAQLTPRGKGEKLKSLRQKVRHKAKQGSRDGTGRERCRGTGAFQRMQRLERE